MTASTNEWVIIKYSGGTLLEIRGDEEYLRKSSNFLVNWAGREPYIPVECVNVLRVSISEDELKQALVDEYVAIETTTALKNIPIIEDEDSCEITFELDDNMLDKIKENALNRAIDDFGKIKREAFLKSFSSLPDNRINYKIHAP